MWQTDRLVITALTVGDAPELFAALDHPEVGTYLGGPDVESLPWLEDRIARLLQGPDDLDVRWLNYVMRRSDGTLIGRLEATLHPGWAEVAWVLGPEHWRQGYATEGAQWLLSHLTAGYGIPEFWATADPRNVASLALMRRLNFTQQLPPWGRAVESYDDGDVVMARLPESMVRS